MRIHREGYPTLMIVGVGAVVIMGLVWFISGDGRMAGGALIVGVVVWGFFAQFFRNPTRIPQQTDPNQVFSPADGTVVNIQRMYENEYFQAERLCISIYMSPLNVHLNRIPLTGVVCYVKYHAGRYLVAFHPKASERNERSTIVIVTKHAQEVLVRQIAGFLARRIVTYTQPEQDVRAGEELGFIKFGSRCDVFLPLDAHVHVSEQQRVRGGETLIAQLIDR